MSDRYQSTSGQTKNAPTVIVVLDESYTGIRARRVAVVIDDGTASAPVSEETTKNG